MMATEVTTENFEDVPNIAEPEQTTTTDSSQDVTSDAIQVNGDANHDDFRQDSEPVEGPFTSAEVSVNGGSDTEASKTETSRTQVDEKGHIRTTSTVKKPATFKAVSVNKTFLAAKGSTSSTSPKPGDKALASAVSAPPAALASVASRPRLVAKSGSGLRDSAPRTAANANGGKVTGAPDANAVWNKNRPAPPPEQKRITDEELKQQYGIHLATRLQSDDPGRQANWADIDDDDEDWAPETIEWTDGTKITVSQQTEEVAPVVPEPIPVVSEVINTESSKPKSPVPSTSNSTVRLGGLSGGSGKGLILKGAVEKPTLVAKPPGPPTPVKSPWAQLPPVDKVAPITMDLPQQQAPRFSQRDPHGFEAMPPPPAKEIAADDFSRSWREGNANTSRELYNSQSGRYEPVNDNRRGPARTEAQSRQPALLQRPSHNDQQGPAEPSPAFQTNRATGQDGAYGRRRASSNVSGGSGNFARRMSKGQEMPPPQELLNARRGSLVAASDSPSSPRMQSPSGYQGGQRQVPPQQWQPKASPAGSHASPASIHGQIAQSPQPPTPGIPLEDEVELQKKIMRESRELARKRRLEEEAREEAERKERIRLKLEAMGPAPEKKTKKENSKDSQVVPTQIQARDTASASTPPKPPIPEVAGEVQQYGMMKVHHPEPITSHAIDFQFAEDFHSNDNNLSSSNRQEVVESSNSSQISQDHRQSQPWQGSSAAGTARFPSWSSPIAQQSRNVWGSPTADALGNGTFNPDLSRVPDMPSTQMVGNAPGPIGPPNHSRANGQYQNRGREQYGQRPAPIAPPRRQQGLSQQENQQRASANAAWNNLPEKLAQEDAMAREEQERRDATRRELGPNSDLQQPIFKDTWRQVALGDDGVRSGIKAISQTVNDGTLPTTAPSWKDFPAQLSPDEAGERAVMEQQDQVRRQNEASGSTMEVPQPVYKDTWRQVQLDNGVRGEILGSTMAVNNGSSTSTSAAVRGSRFFPQSKNVRFDEMNASLTRPGSPSPPPPTMAGHPAYDGDSLHPHVLFPRPPPVVRLPPAPVLAPIGPPKPITSFAVPVTDPAVILPPTQVLNFQQKHHDIRFSNEHHNGSRPTQGQAVWQDRINSLIGRKSSPPKSHAFAVDSSSKNALELPASYFSATVSLPSTLSSPISSDESDFETKPMAEECFEEQEMGSLPAIRVPNKAPEAAWHLALPQLKPLPRKFAVAHPTSSEDLTFFPQVTNNGDIIHIFLPGMDEEKRIPLPHKTESRQKSNSRRGAQSRGASRHASAGHPRGSRPRDSSSGLPSPTLDQASTSSTPSSSSRGGGRSRGGFGSNWNTNRHVSTPTNAINV